MKRSPSLRKISDIRSKLARGHVLLRALRLIVRCGRWTHTTVTLAVSAPQRSHVCIATLNADEDNAIVMALVYSQMTDHVVLFLSPDPVISTRALHRVSKRMSLGEVARVRVRRTTNRHLLAGYRRAEITYATHVLLPGTAITRKRTHVQLTHGVGAKRDVNFRSPINALVDLCPVWWVGRCLDLRISTDTARVTGLPRIDLLEVARTERDEIRQMLSIAPQTKIVILAPTYRSIDTAYGVHAEGPQLSSEIPSSANLTLAEISALARERGIEVILKRHPHDVSDLSSLGISIMTNAMLDEIGLSPYEFLACADGLISDYSSIAFDAAAAGVPIALFCPDYDGYDRGPRGLLEPDLRTVAGSIFIENQCDIAAFFDSVGGNAGPWAGRQRRAAAELGLDTGGTYIDRLLGDVADLRAGDRPARSRRPGRTLNYEEPASRRA